MTDAATGVRRLAYAGALTALAVGICYLEQIPWFELQSVVVFAAGYLLGARSGAIVGGLAMGLYSLANPYGLAHPVVFASQVIGRAFVGLTGGWAASLGLSRSTGGRAALLVAWAAAGAVFYDLLTNLATGVVFGALVPSLVMGVPWMLAHLLSNAAVYAVVGSPLTTALDVRRGALVACAACALLVVAALPARAQVLPDTAAGATPVVPDTVLRILPDTTRRVVTPPPAVVVLRGPSRWAIETNAQERLRHAPLNTDDAWSAVGAAPRFYEDKGDAEPLSFAGFPSVILGGAGDVASFHARSTPWHEAGAVPGGAREATGWTPTSFGATDSTSGGWALPWALPGWGARGSYGSSSEPRRGHVASSSAWLGIGRHGRTEQGFLLDAARDVGGTDVGVLWTAWTRASDSLGVIGPQGEHALQVRLHAQSARVGFVASHDAHRVAVQDVDDFEHESRGTERTALQASWSSAGGSVFARAQGEHIEQDFRSNGAFVDLLAQRTRENSAGLVVGTRRGGWTGTVHGGWSRERFRRTVGLTAFAPGDVETWRGGAAVSGAAGGGLLGAGLEVENALGRTRVLPGATWLKDVGPRLRLDVRASGASAPIHVETGAADPTSSPESLVTHGWTGEIAVRYGDPEAELSIEDTSSVRSAPSPIPSTPFSGRVALVGWQLTDQLFEPFGLFARDVLEGETVVADAKGAALVAAFEWWPKRWLVIGGNGFAVAHEIPVGVAVATPDYRWIGWAGPRAQLFKGSLDLQILGELDVVGPRAAPDEDLPAFVRPGARAVLGFGSAWVVVRGIDLDDARHPLPGRRFLTGERLLSPGREIRASLEWRFRN